MSAALRRLLRPAIGSMCSSDARGKTNIRITNSRAFRVSDTFLYCVDATFSCLNGVIGIHGELYQITGMIFSAKSTELHDRDYR